MKDFGLDIVARNTIMLLIALVVDNMDEAVDCMIHIWYSALIRKSDLDLLQRWIRPLVTEVCEKIKDKGPTALLTETWQFGQRSPTLVLTKASWNIVLCSMDISDCLRAELAHQIRRDVALAEARKDYRDRHLLFRSPSTRIAKTRFREDGLLLPFGSPRSDFQVPNP